jgi:hypothetical protein
MKKVILASLLLVTSFICLAESTDNTHGPKKGYNYKKHYRSAATKHFFTRVFNLNNCHGRQNVN